MTRQTHVTATPASDPVADLYDKWSAYQWDRLDVHRSELYIHLHVLQTEIAPGSQVLDLGAGPGRYSIELARLGHRVVVADISPALIELARRHASEAEGVGDRLRSFQVLDARDLSRFDDAVFDAVVAFGPFYHLEKPADRERAAAEAARVLRPGGRLFATFQPRPYWLSTALRDFVSTSGAKLTATQRGEYLDHLEEFWRGGKLTRLESEFLKLSHFCRLDEIEPLMAAAGISLRRLVASNGGAANWSSKSAWENLAGFGAEVEERVFRLLLAIAEEPGVLAMSDQVLFVGEKSS